jgi:hypothetical protein
LITISFFGTFVFAQEAASQESGNTPVTLIPALTQNTLTMVVVDWNIFFHPGTENSKRDKVTINHTANI